MPQNTSSVEHDEFLFNFTDSTFLTIENAFKKRDVDGCFIIYDVKKDTALTYNTERATQYFLPASTFKIPNSLIALECKAVKDVNEIIPWDGEERIVPSWNQDQTMRTAFRYSAVWFYQELARRIGMNQMNKWVKKMNYGNQTIGPGIDDFWLVGDLRISPQQQADFLKRLLNDDLPARKRNMALVRDIMIEESNERYVLRGKTGWANFGTPVGWYVGWLQVNERNFIFVMNMDIIKAGDQIFRKEITNEILNNLFEIKLVI
jgi:beta-lactamase class D